MPGSFAESPDGLVYYADGFGPVLRWDGFTAQMERAGVEKPSTAPTLSSGSGRGSILGTYQAYVRFVDRLGNVSDLSPISASVDVQVTAAAGISGATATSPIVVTSHNHGLTTGARVTITGVLGQTGANGTWDIVVIDNDNFSLTGSVSSGTYTGGGTYVTGADEVHYTNVPLPTDPQVRRRQLLRNTDGQLTTFYVDLDTTDLTLTAFDSSRTDDDLSAQTAVPIVDADTGDDLANLYARPPEHKPSLAHHQGRMFYCGDIEYAEGAVALTYGSTTVTGIGTEWTSAVAGRYLYVVGGNDKYLISSVDAANQTLTLSTGYLGSTDPFAYYAIRCAPVEGRTVYYSEAGKPEAVPVLNAITLPDDGDQQVGGLSFHSFLYFVERHHIYRYTFQSDPADDGALFINSQRGCINHRCWVQVEDSVFMLDEEGVHVLNRAEPDDSSISTPVQTLFRPDGEPRINWSASRWFHATHDPATETIRWFVAMSGQYLPRHALCFQYTLKRWWIEEWPFPVGASCLGKLARTAAQNTWGVGRQQVFLGSTARRVLAFGAGQLDGCNPAHFNAGAVVSAGRLSLTAAQNFSSDAVGCPLAISSGPGKGQVRLVTAVSGATLFIKQPWLITPTAKSTFQLGGIPWEWKSGWFRWVDEESQNPRRVELMFEPTDSDIKLTLRRYRDRSDEPVQSAVTRTDDGVAMTAGSGELEISLSRSSGFAQARLDGSKEQYAHGPRLISVGLSGSGGTESVKIYQVTIDGVMEP